MNKETIAIHYGYNKDNQQTMTVPIYQTTAYEYKNTEHAANLFSLKEIGNIYTRIGNPTTDIFEKRFAELEGGIAGISTASGMSAIFYSVINLAEVGDNIIVSTKLYGGTVTLFTHTLKRFGIEARFFNPHKPKEIENLIDDKTKAIFFETITNPSIDVADFNGIVDIANKNNIVTIVDNTVATPILCNPIKLDCDVVVHSTSKYTTGQGLAIGGIIVEGKSTKAKLLKDRYKHFNEPDESYHGLIYNETPFPPFILRVRLALLRDIGAVPSPFNSWLFIQGLETLPLRMKKHSENGLLVAKFLETHSKIKSVKYPALESGINYKFAKKYLKGGYSGLLSFEVETFEDAKKIVDNLKIFTLVTNIGDSKSIITHPASTTHQQLNKDEMKACGVSSGLIRLSIGIENGKDLIEDLRMALIKI